MAPILNNAVDCALAIADRHHAHRDEALEKLRVLANPDSVDVRDKNQLRAIDILARGFDDAVSAQAVEILADNGSQITVAPGVSDAPPLHAACYHGNWRITKTLLDYEGVDVHALGTSRSMRLSGGAPVHAVASGFREAKEDDFANCLNLLLRNGADIDAKDRLRKKPIDIALAGCVSTGRRSLVDALFQYGVKTAASGTDARGTSANDIANEMAKRGEANRDMGIAALKSTMMSIGRKAKEAHVERAAEAEKQNAPAHSMSQRI